MFRTARGALLALVLLAPAVLPLYGCQDSSDDEETLDVDDFVDSTVTPDPAIAVESTDGRTFRVDRGDQPDDIIPFKWKTAFNVSWTINNNATDDDIDLEFPVDATGTTVTIQQASGGVPNPPTAGDVEQVYSEISQVTGNQIGAVGGSISMRVDVWYWLPSASKEALIKVNLSFRDDDGSTFTKIVEVRVAP